MEGSTISHYKILSKLGEGGMGVVYQAEDTKLGRQVALKFLAAHLLNDEEAKQRFLREAKAAAALHHPNVCPVHEIDEVDGKTFLAMAFLKGETLEDRLAGGPLALKDALDIGRQAAEGLQGAHAEGIVHRDIKPANILISPEGRATIMDFGLARLTEASKLTQAGQTMGTAAYMSPEQLQGGEVDQRTDIWALGCVLHEMVAGVRPFKGQYDQALAYEVVHEEPEPLTGVRAGVPMELDVFVGKCLAKDAGDRYENASELAKDLRTLGEKLKSGRSTILRTTNLTAGVPGKMSGGQAADPALTSTSGGMFASLRSLRGPQTLVAALSVALLGLLAIQFTQTSTEDPERILRRFSFDGEGYLPEGAAVSLSPDGKSIAYITSSSGRSSIWVRSLVTETSRELSGTEGAVSLFWSPDSSSLGFAAGRRPDFELKRVAIDGGTPIKLCEFKGGVSGPLLLGGGTWSPDGESIVFSAELRLYEIAARGGQPRLLFDPGDSPRPWSYDPHFLPAEGGPPALVYAASGSSSDGPRERMLAVLNLATGERRELVPGAHPVYSPDGYLVHRSAAFSEVGLFALPFSRATLEPVGEGFPISVDGVYASLSRDGALAYADPQNPGRAMRGLVWRSRTGEAIETVGQPQLGLREFALSHDLRWVATTVDEPAGIWGPGPNSLNHDAIDVRRPETVPAQLVADSGPR